MPDDEPIPHGGWFGGWISILVTPVLLITAAVVGELASATSVQHLTDSPGTGVGSPSSWSAASHHWASASWSARGWAGSAGLLVAVFASVLIFTGISWGMDRWLEGDAVIQKFDADRAGGRQLVSGSRCPVVS